MSIQSVNEVNLIGETLKTIGTVIVPQDGFCDPYIVVSLYDTGCSLFTAKTHVFPSHWWKMDKTKDIVYGNQTTEKATRYCDVTFNLGGLRFSGDFWELDSMEYDMIIGNNFWNFLAKTKNFYMVTDEGIFIKGKNKIPFLPPGMKTPTLPWKLFTISEFATHKRGGFLEFSAQNQNILAHNSSPILVQKTIHLSHDDNIRINTTQDGLKELRNKFEKLLILGEEIDLIKRDKRIKEINEILDKNWTKDPLALVERCTSKCVIRFQNPENVKPISFQPFAVNPKDKDDFDMHIQEYKKYNLIRPASSEWAARAFLVRNHAEQKRGKSRMVIDYSPLNRIIKKDAYSIAHKGGIFMQLMDMKIFSKLDCKSGFFQIPMDPDSIKYTGFCTPLGNFEWLVMPMGLCNAPSIFQRRMNQALEGLNYCCVVYIDDILIFSKNEEDHFRHLKEVAIRLRDNGIILSKEKAELFKENITFLGSDIAPGGVVVLQQFVIDKLLEYPNILEGRKQVESFNGLLNYIAVDRVPELALIRRNLVAKLRKNVPWTWEEDDTKRVLFIKEKCKDLPPLHIPKEGDELDIHSDSSDFAWAIALIIQRKMPDNTVKSLIGRYGSGLWSKGEQSWTIFSKELRAIRHALEKFQIYLYKPVTVKCDNSAIVLTIINEKNIFDTQKRKATEIRDLEYILTYKYNGYLNIQHIPSKENHLADRLSRIPRFI